MKQICNILMRREESSGKCKKSQAASAKRVKWQVRIFLKFLSYKRLTILKMYNTIDANLNPNVAYRTYDSRCIAFDARLHSKQKIITFAMTKEVKKSPVSH